jgi:hypothetical protein
MCIILSSSMYHFNIVMKFFPTFTIVHVSLVGSRQMDFGEHNHLVLHISKARRSLVTSLLLLSAQLSFAQHGVNNTKSSCL